jgi:DNA ligase (NAD+)
MGETSSENIIREVEKSKTLGLDRLLFGLGIRHVGQKAAKLIASKFQNIDNLLNASLDEISAIDTLGSVIAQSVVMYFKTSQNIELIDSLKKHGVNMSFKNNIKNQKLSGKTFVLTGTLENYTRGEASQIIESMGGKVSASVSKNTAFVLAGSEPGSKIDKAKKLGVKVISENDFLEMIKS